MTTLTLHHNPLAPVLDAIAGFAALFSAAVAVSASVEAHRAPDAEALKTLGIDPALFPKV